MNRQAIVVAASVVLAAGCVERRFVVETNPPGALVLHNGKPIGVSPADNHFVYYGKHEFTLVKDGYQTTKVEERIRAPWYQWPGLDFVSEVLWPFALEDVRRFRYDLPLRQAVRPEDLLSRGQEMRGKAKGLEVPAGSAEATASKLPFVPTTSTANLAMPPGGAVQTVSGSQPP